MHLILKPCALVVKTHKSDLSFQVFWAQPCQWKVKALDWAVLWQVFFPNYRNELVLSRGLTSFVLTVRFFLTANIISCRECVYRIPLHSDKKNGPMKCTIYSKWRLKLNIRQQEMVELQLRKNDQSPVTFSQPMASWLERSMELLLGSSEHPQRPPKSVCPQPTANDKQIHWVGGAMMMSRPGFDRSLQWSSIISETHCVARCRKTAVSGAS